MSSTFRLASFNCAGVKPKLPYISSLCDQADIVFLQETWLMPHELSVLNSVHQDFNKHSISAVDTEQSILISRPYGGLTILYRKHLNISGSVINLDENRLVGFMVNHNNFKYLYSAYF